MYTFIDQTIAVRLGSLKNKRSSENQVISVPVSFKFGLCSADGPETFRDGRRNITPFGNKTGRRREVLEITIDKCYV